MIGIRKWAATTPHNLQVTKQESQRSRTDMQLNVLFFHHHRFLQIQMKTQVTRDRRSASSRMSIPNPRCIDLHRCIHKRISTTTCWYIDHLTCKDKNNNIMNKTGYTHTWNLKMLIVYLKRADIWYL